MVEVTCKDCGRLGDEAPDDPAPNLCPGCYEARLDIITEKFEVMVQSLGHPLSVSMWLEQALMEIGGETEDAAREHAAELFGQLCDMLTSQ